LIGLVLSLAFSRPAIRAQEDRPANIADDRPSASVPG
jgi:hypothetical protein